jgi:hypothetical protein
MIKLFSLKQQKKDEVPGRAGNQKKASAAQLRITKGLLIKTNVDLVTRDPFILNISFIISQILMS